MFYVSLIRLHPGARWTAQARTFDTHDDALTYGERMARDVGAGAREYAVGRVSLDYDPTVLAPQPGDTPKGSPDAGPDAIQRRDTLSLLARHAAARPGYDDKI